MQLTPRELDKLIIYQVAQIANSRKARGIKLNHPESVAVISAAILEGAREGKKVEDLQKEAQKVLTRNDVMEGVPEMIERIDVEGVFPDGTKLVTVNNPIQ